MSLQQVLKLQVCISIISSITQHAKRTSRIIFPSVPCLAVPYFSTLAHTRYEFRKITGYTQTNGAVSKLNKKSISHLTLAQRTPSSAAANVQVSHALITTLQCVHPGSHDTQTHRQKAFSCRDAIFETGPAVSMRSEPLAAQEKLGTVAAAADEVSCAV